MTVAFLFARLFYFQLYVCVWACVCVPVPPEALGLWELESQTVVNCPARVLQTLGPLEKPHVLLTFQPCQPLSVHECNIIEICHDHILSFEGLEFEKDAVGSHSGTHQDHFW